jgi:hypothetical protein
MSKPSYDTVSALLAQLIARCGRAAAEGIESALAAAPRPPATTPTEPVEPKPRDDEPLDLDELTIDLEKRLTGISADLAAVTALWDQMDEGPRAALLDQLRYYAELHAYYSAAGSGPKAKSAGQGRRARRASPLRRGGRSRPVRGPLS